MGLTSAGIVVDIEGECVDDVADPLDQMRVGQTAAQRVVEHLHTKAYASF